MRNERAGGLAEGMKKGRAEGLAEGMAKGMEKERAKAEAETLDIARQLLGTGMPASQVALLIQLPLDTVNALNK